MRCLFVHAVATTVAGLTATAVAPATARGWTAVDHHDVGTLPLDEALSAGCAWVLLACLGWGWVTTTVTVLTVWQTRGAAPHRVVRDAPSGLLRRLVLAACGVALVGTTGPAVAGVADHHARPGLTGLPLPDRATAPVGDRPPHVVDRARSLPVPDPPRSVVVAPGDSLWSIAVDDLPPEASDAQVTARWHAVYAANCGLIGADPNLIEPGLRLLLPRKDRS
jgi:hypothetical protein